MPGSCLTQSVTRWCSWCHLWLLEKTLSEFLWMWWSYHASELLWCSSKFPCHWTDVQWKFVFSPQTQVGLLPGESPFSWLFSGIQIAFSLTLISVPNHLYRSSEILGETKTFCFFCQHFSGRFPSWTGHHLAGSWSSYHHGFAFDHYWRVLSRFLYCHHHITDLSAYCRVNSIFS